ncbi:apolipoprotein N-acyltransferase [Bdellovibrionota bacterium FG-2]
MNQKNRTKFWIPDPLTVLSAALIVFAFPPWDFAPLIWISLIPWFFALDRCKSWKNTAAQAMWLGIFMSLGGFYWVAFVLQEFGNLPWSLAIVGMLGFTLIGQPQFLAFALARRFFLGRISEGRGRIFPTALLPVLISLLYTGIDWTIPKLFVDTLGHSLYAQKILRQSADLGGAALLTFLIFWVNEGLYQSIKTWRQTKGVFRVVPLLGPVLLSVALGAYGFYRLKEIQTIQANPERFLQAAVIQGNIGDFDKIASERGVKGAGQKVLDTYISLSDQALALTPKPQVLIWPETAYPSNFRHPQTADELARDQRVEAFVKDRKTPLLFGGYDRFNDKDHNAFFYLFPQPRVGFPDELDLRIYRKNVLLLFGEYIPGAETFSFIKQAFPQVGNFGRGVGPEVLPIPLDSAAQVNTGPIICYEALFTNYVVAAARNGSQLILNITNDSWFGARGEPELHLALTTFRSIETRLPQLRGTNTGISALILPDGEIIEKTEKFIPTIMNVQIPIMPKISTLILKWGDWFGPLALLLGGLGLLGLIHLSKAWTVSPHNNNQP